MAVAIPLSYKSSMAIILNYCCVLPLMVSISNPVFFFMLLHKFYTLKWLSITAENNSRTKVATSIQLSDSLFHKGHEIVIESYAMQKEKQTELMMKNVVDIY